MHVGQGKPCPAGPCHELQHHHHQQPTLWLWLWLRLWLWPRQSLNYKTAPQALPQSQCQQSLGIVRHGLSYGFSFSQSISQKVFCQAWSALFCDKFVLLLATTCDFLQQSTTNTQLTGISYHFKYNCQIFAGLKLVEQAETRRVLAKSQFIKKINDKRQIALNVALIEAMSACIRCMNLNNNNNNKKNNDKPNEFY